MDTSTLIIVTAITLILTSGSILISWLINRRIPGANHWVSGYFLIASAVLLQATQQYLHPVISIGAANHIIVAGFYLTWMGARIFHEKSALSVRYFITVQLVLLIMLALLGLESSGFEERTILMSTTLGVITFLTARELIPGDSSKELASTVTGIVFALLTIAFIARGLSVDMLPEKSNMITAGNHSRISYLLGIIFNILIAFGFIIMLTERLEKRLKQLANTDFLTGLPSRRAIVNTAERLISRCNKNGTRIALIMMDLDNFKDINDTHGHLSGDAVLRHFSEIMRQCFRPDDLIGRMGGEEFIAILANTQPANAIKAAERLRKTFEKASTSSNAQLIDATVSIGIATTEHGAENFEQLFKDADHALYQAKEAGRNCTLLFKDCEHSENSPLTNPEASDALQQSYAET